MARSITSAQFTQLKAWFRIEPSGFEIENFRSGTIASTIARVHGNKTKAADFYPQVGPVVVEVDTQSQEEQMAMLLAAGRPKKRKAR